MSEGSIREGYASSSAELRLTNFPSSQTIRSI